MDIRLRATLVIMFVFYLGLIVYFLKKKILNLQYSLLWLLAAVSLLVVIIFPDVINTLSAILGIYDPVNMVFLVAVFFILLILLSVTAIVSKMTNTIYSLTQQLAILDHKVRALEKK